MLFPSNVLSEAYQSVEKEEEASFCEQKEAKKLCQLEFIGCRGGTPIQSNKSFLHLFFKKRSLFLSSRSRKAAAGAT